MTYDLLQTADGWYIVSVTDQWFGPYPSELLAQGALNTLLTTGKI